MARVAWRLCAEALPVETGDIGLDIGSGDGVVLMAAAQQGARAIGYEINPFLVLISRWRLRKLSGVRVHWANIWRQPVLDKVTVMYTFGDGRDIAKMFRLADRQAADKRISWLFSLSAAGRLYIAQSISYTDAYE